MREDAKDVKAKDVKAKSPKRQRVLRFSAEVQSSDFMALDCAHPYGVLPGGNRFLNASSKEGPNDLLSDECWDEILGFCSGRELGNLVQTCRYFYVAGHQPERWRDLVLKKQGGKAISTTGPTWKDTYVKIFHPDTDEQTQYKPHVPISVCDVYSDYHYRLHSCRSFAIPPVWLSPESGTVDRVPVKDMTVERFLENYEHPNRPVVVEGAATSWKAFEKWQDPAYCQQHGNGRTFRATSGTANLPADFTLPAYYSYCQSPNLEEAPLYHFDRTALTPGSHLWNDYMPDLQKACPYWDPEKQADTGHDLFQILGEGQRPDHTWLILGPQRSGSVFHIDPNATHAWNAAICGRKRWLFYPPGATPPGVHPSPDGDEMTLPMSVGEWVFSFWDEHVERKKTAPASQRPLECTALPGDVVFIPHGWWHMVINLDEMNVAITHNYVGTTNLCNVLRFLETKEDQVSGCRDRAQSIKPERLLEEFKQELTRLHPEWLQTAMKESDWTCKTWSSKTKAWSSSIPTVETKPMIGNVNRKEAVAKDKGATNHDSVMSKAKDSQESTFSFSFL
jgi:hypothetical protein